MPSIVAYLDILGFSQFMREDAEAAEMLLHDYQLIFNNKITDDKSHPVAEYPRELKKIASIQSFDGVDYFLPFSDSVFIVGQDGGRLLKQIGSFIGHSFLLTAGHYLSPEDRDNPTMGKIQEINIRTQETTRRDFHYYPIMFRGGVAFGGCNPYQLGSKVNGAILSTAVLSGEAVVRAVARESLLKGPRICFGKDVYDNLDDETKLYCKSISGRYDLYELLWLALDIIDSNGPESEKEKFVKYYQPVRNLWAGYKGSPVEDHYLAFIGLIIESTIFFYDRIWGLGDYAREFISGCIKDAELREAFDSLLKS